MRRAISVAFLCFGVACLFTYRFAHRSFIAQLQIVETQDAIGAIACTIGATYSDRAFEKGEIAREGKKRFAWLRVRDREVIDEWGSPIQIELTKERLVIRSAGPDGKMNTSDDLIYDAEIRRRE
jgi:hypothetical protein